MQITFDTVIATRKDGNVFINQMLISITKVLHHLSVEELFDDVKENFLTT